MGNFGAQPCDSRPQDWGFVNRLDLETDGPVLAAKTFRAQRMLQVEQG